MGSEQTNKMKKQMAVVGRKVGTIAKSGTIVLFSGLAALFYFLFFISFCSFDHLSEKWNRKEHIKDKTNRDIHVFYDPICSKSIPNIPFNVFFHKLHVNHSPKFKISKMPYVCIVLKGVYIHITKTTDDNGVSYLKSELKCAGSIYLVNCGDKYKLEIPKNSSTCWRIILPLRWSKPLLIKENKTIENEKSPVAISEDSNIFANDDHDITIDKLD